MFPRNPQFHEFTPEAEEWRAMHKLADAHWRGECARCNAAAKFVLPIRSPPAAAAAASAVATGITICTPRELRSRTWTVELDISGNKSGTGNRGIWGHHNDVRIVYCIDCGLLLDWNLPSNYSFGRQLYRY